MSSLVPKLAAGDQVWCSTKDAPTSLRAVVPVEVLEVIEPSPLFSDLEYAQIRVRGLSGHLQGIVWKTSIVVADGRLAELYARPHKMAGEISHQLYGGEGP